MRVTRAARYVAVVAGGTVLGIGVCAGIAAAVSAGPYSNSNNGCPQSSDAYSFYGAYPGCHNFQVLVTDDSGHQYAEAGTNQIPQNGENVHSGTVMVTPNGDGNPYGNQNGQPNGAQTAADSDYSGQSSDQCPTASQYKPTDGSAPADPIGTQTDNNAGGCPQPGSSPVSGPGAGAGFDTNWQPIPPGQCGIFSLVTYALGPCPIDPTKWSAPSRAPTIAPWEQTGTPNQNALDLILTGGEIYMAADDNLDSGEHDGVDGQYGSGLSYNGPSDGGAVAVAWQPRSGADTVIGWQQIVLHALQTGSVAPLAPMAEDPIPVAGAGGDGCADQICVGAYSNQQTLYRGGGGSGSHRDVYNYAGKDWGPYDCNSGSTFNERACTTEAGSSGTTAACSTSSPGYSSTTGDSNADCGSNYYRQQEAASVTSEPGVMVFADPDPQASPAAPQQLTPLPALYAGTCGVVVGGGPLSSPSASPTDNTALAPLLSTNSAGQVVAADPTGC